MEGGGKPVGRQIKRQQQQQQCCARTEAAETQRKRECERAREESAVGSAGARSGGEGRGDSPWVVGDDVFVC